MEEKLETTTAVIEAPDNVWCERAATENAVHRSLAAYLSHTMMKSGAIDWALPPAEIVSTGRPTADRAAATAGPAAGAVSAHAADRGLRVEVKRLRVAEPRGSALTLEATEFLSTHRMAGVDQGDVFETWHSAEKTKSKEEQGGYKSVSVFLESGNSECVLCRCGCEVMEFSAANAENPVYAATEIAKQDTAFAALREMYASRTQWRRRSRCSVSNYLGKNRYQ